MANSMRTLRAESIAGTRTWHGSAFVLESLLLLVFLAASMAIIVQLLVGSYARSIDAERLAFAVEIASENAEAFTASPTAESGDYFYSNNDLSEGLFVDAGKISHDELMQLNELADAGKAYKLENRVMTEDKGAGTVYKAHITVKTIGKTIYSLNASSYVPNEKGDDDGE